MEELSKQVENQVVRYVESDFVGDLDVKKSILGYLFMVNGYLINQKTNLQHIVALSFIEVEFVIAIEAVKKSKQLNQILNEFWLK